MFITITQIGDSKYIIKDSIFVDEMYATGRIAAIIKTYEARNLPVAANLARFYISRCSKNRFNQIESDASYFTSMRPELKFFKYKNCLINHVKKLEYVGIKYFEV